MPVPSIKVYLKLFHIKTYTALKCLPIWYKMSWTFVSGSSFIESRDSWNETQMLNTSFDWFSMDLPLFLFILCSPIKKRESPYSRKLSYNILIFIISYFSYSHYIPDWLNWIPRKFYIDVLLLPLKWKLDLFTWRKMCVKIQKNMSCKAKLQHASTFNYGT